MTLRMIVENAAFVSMKSFEAHSRVERNAHQITLFDDRKSFESFKFQSRKILKNPS